MCGKEHLSDVDKKFSMRTEEEMKKIYFTMIEARKNSNTKKDFDNLSKAWSLHPVAVSWFLL